MTRSVPELIERIAQIFDEVGIEYVIGGSFASSMLGEPRATQDVDVAVLLDEPSLERLLSITEGEFYVPVEAARASLAHAVPMPSFNLVDLEGHGKVDVFVLGDSVLDRRQIDHRVRVRIADGFEAWVTAPIEVVLRKLLWMSVGENMSDRQWRDVVGVLSANRDSIDLDDLRSTAAELGLADLLVEALRQAGE